MKLLCLIRSITSGLFIYAVIYVRSKVEYAPVWNSVTSTDARNLRPFLLSFSHVPYIYNFSLENLSPHSLRKRRHHLDHFFFLAQVYFGIKSCTSILESVSLHVSTRYVRDCVCPSNKHCPSARRSDAANVMGKDLYKVKT
jgi:hypothetical protein